MRSQLFVQTKVNKDHSATLVDGRTITECVLASVAALLRNLNVTNVTNVDSLVLHSPYRKFEQTLEAWRAMEEAVESGKARQLGISNAASLKDLQRLHKKVRIKPVVVQQRFHLRTGFEIEMRRWCAKNGIHFQSFWTLTANSKPGQPGKDAVLSSAVASLAKKYGVSPQCLFYRWVMADGCCPLNGTCSVEHMKEDLEVTSIPLTDQDAKAIARVVYGPLG